MRSKHLPLLCTGFILALLALTYALFRQNSDPESNRLQQLELEYQSALRTKKMRLQQLKEEVNALSDPAAGEYALIEELGVVPKGMKRVVNHDS